jgi:hypothetical protein
LQSVQVASKKSAICKNLQGMGGGVSTLPCVVEEHPYLLERFHERYAEIFLDLHHEFKATLPALSDRAMRDIIVEKLKENEMDIIHAIVKEEAHSKSHNQLIERFECLNLGNGNGRGGIHSLNFLCCVDGSQKSVIAFENMLSFTEKIEFVEIFHAFHAQDENPLQMDEDVVARGAEGVKIQSFYERRLKEMLSSTSYSFSLHERFDRTPFHVLSDLLEPSPTAETKEDERSPNRLAKPDFIFLGYTAQQNESSSSLTLLGSTADIALRSIHFPCVVCKKSPTVSPSRFPGTTISKSCVMMINFSKNSKTGLMLLLPLLSPHDSLRLVYFAKPDVSQKSIDTLTSFYQTQLDSYGPGTSEIKIISIGTDEKVGERIVEYCNERTQRTSWREEEEVDFLAIAPREKLLIAQPLTEYVLEHVRCNVILCKC